MEKPSLHQSVTSSGVVLPMPISLRTICDIFLDTIPQSVPHHTEAALWRSRPAVLYPRESQCLPKHIPTEDIVAMKIPVDPKHTRLISVIAATVIALACGTNVREHYISRAYTHVCSMYTRHGLHNSPSD